MLNPEAHQVMLEISHPTSTFFSSDSEETLYRGAGGGVC